MNKTITKLTFLESAVIYFMSFVMVMGASRALQYYLGFNWYIAFVIMLFIAYQFIRFSKKALLEANNKELDDARSLEAYENDLHSQCKDVQLFNLQDISQSYKALGSVESSDVNKELAQGKLCKQAKALGGNAILNLTLNIETKTEGSIHTSRDLIHREAHVTGSTISTSIFYYTGTAILMEQE